MAIRTFVVYAAAYDSLDDATVDYDVARRLFSRGTMTIFDATLFERRDGRPTTVNTLVALFLPPCLIRDPATVRAEDPMNGRLWRGMPPEDLDALTALFQTGRAWLIVIADASVRPALADPDRSVLREFERHLSVDDSNSTLVARSHEMS